MPRVWTSPGWRSYLLDWRDSQSPYDLLAARLGKPQRVGVDNSMPAEHVLRLRAAQPTAEQVLAGDVVRQLRMRKDAEEVEHLRAAGAAIDRVHRRMGEFLRVGRTEREAAELIAQAIVDEGHADFVVVGSGPNGASPHHLDSERVLEAGDPVVIDIGGPAPSGYFSDCTRMYVVGGEPDDRFEEYFAVLHAAQLAAVASVRPGVTAESVDSVARTIIADAGYGDAFVHRTGHGIGIEVHEEPYVVTGNPLVLEAGMTFSVEPGIYLDGLHGARIEDIVVVTHDGVERLSVTDREYVVLPG